MIPRSRLRMLANKTQNYEIVVILILIIIGVLGSIFAGTRVNSQNRDFLLKRARTVSYALSTEQIYQLKGDATDSNSLAYNGLKKKLADVRKANNDVRFVYLTGKKNGQVFFYVDSESSDSKDYSPPGEIYTEASQAFIKSFDNGSAFVEGPYKDRWGNWLSALAPILDENGKVIAVVGIDSAASTHYWQIALYALIPMLMMLLPVSLLLYERRIRHRERYIEAMKKSFVSIASHELRSPLNGMLWAIQNMLKKPKNLDSLQQETLKDMYASTESSLTTINEILDLSIFERGQGKKLQRVPLNLVTLTNDVRSSLKLAAQEKNIAVHITRSWPTKAMTIGDPGALKRAFVNIVSNAIKYSPDTSQITIDYQNEANKHIISITDAGIGIAKEDIEKVLSGYYRAPNAAKLQSYGTGLGLWITRLIIEQHGGKLWIESQLNIGTTVYISLPDKS